MYRFPGRPGTCGNTSCPPPPTRAPVRATSVRAASRSGSPNPAPRATTWSGAAAASACTPAVVARGSPPGVSTTSTPAARIVARAASDSGAPTRVSTTVPAGGAGRRVGGSTAGGGVDGDGDAGVGDVTRPDGVGD